MSVLYFLTSSSAGTACAMMAPVGALLGVGVGITPITKLEVIRAAANGSLLAATLGKVTEFWSISTKAGKLTAQDRLLELHFSLRRSSKENMLNLYLGTKTVFTIEVGYAHVSYR